MPVCSSILYVEGNLETKIFNDPITGLVRRIREIAIRRNGILILFPPLLINYLFSVGLPAHSILVLSYFMGCEFQN